MFKFLKKFCKKKNTVVGKTCDNVEFNTNEFSYQGPTLTCLNIPQGTPLTEVFQMIDNYLCSTEFTIEILNYIENNIEENTEFVEIINGLINCETILECVGQTTSSTTTLT